jgi:hypothetical protein
MNMNRIGSAAIPKPSGPSPTDAVRLEWKPSIMARDRMSVKELAVNDVIIGEHDAQFAVSGGGHLARHAHATWDQGREAACQHAGFKGVDVWSIGGVG